MPAIGQEGLLQDETMQEDQGSDGAQASSPELQMSLSFAFIVKHWNSVADLSVDAVPYITLQCIIVRTMTRVYV